MKRFSLTSYDDTKDYDSHKLPLVRQMTYLEELTLSIRVHQQSTFIDGLHLENEMLIYLPQFQIFTINITTHGESMSNEMYMQSNNDLRRTFLNWRYSYVDCYISHYPNNEPKSHIYSTPCIITDIYIITYGFLGDLCTNVRLLYLSEKVYPVKYEFFLRIARAFLLITHLTVLNNRLFENTDKTNDQITSIVEFHHFTTLTIHFQRAIYVEQFLVDTNTHLPHLVDLTISYDNLITVTKNFFIKTENQYQVTYVSLIILTKIDQI
jgi:hypothetical protein